MLALCSPSTSWGLPGATSFGGVCSQSLSPPLTHGPALFNDTCPLSTPETGVDKEEQKTNR